MNKKRTDRAEKFDRRINRILVLLLAVAAVAAGIVLCVLQKKPMPKPPREGAVIEQLLPDGGTAVEGPLPGTDAEAEMLEQMQREADVSTFAFRINARPVFKGGEGALRIENPSRNAYPFVVKIFLNDSGEEVYDSGGILPNHHIDMARLAKELPEGTHAATAYVYAYDPATKAYGGKAAVQMTLMIFS